MAARQQADSDFMAPPVELSVGAALDYSARISHHPRGMSPFIRRVSRHVRIDEESQAFLQSLQAEPMVIRADTELYSIRDEVRDIYIVQMGWLLGYSILPSGQRHIHRIYHPGDIVGIEDINWNYHTSNVKAATPVVLTSLGRGRLRGVFEDSPRLARAIFSMTMMDQVHLFDSLKAVGRMSSEARAAAFILQMWSRARAAGTSIGEATLFMPLTQTEIGDAMGLTNVSVSRAMTSLADSGLIRRSGHRLELLDIKTLKRMCDYSDRTMRVDRDWVEQREALSA